MKRHNRGAGIIVIHADTCRVLLLLKKRYPNWEYPKGAIEPGETELTAAQRELREEVKIKKITIARGFKHKIHYHFWAEGDIIYRTITYFLGFTRDRVRLSSEHQAYKWCTVSQARSLFKHENYLNLLKLALVYLNKQKGTNKLNI